ncbi:hypothetical protein Drorol1_Dr00005212, partial [Drosera rotundifolia]
MKKQPSINIQPLCLLLAHGETRRIQRSTAISIIQLKICSKSREEEDNSQRDNKKKNCQPKSRQPEVGSQPENPNQSITVVTPINHLEPPPSLLRNHLPNASPATTTTVFKISRLPSKFTTSSATAAAPHLLHPNRLKPTIIAPPSHPKPTHHATLAPSRSSSTAS